MRKYLHSLLLMFFPGCFHTTMLGDELPLIIAAEQLSTRFIILDPQVDPLSKKAIKWAWTPRQSPKVKLDNFYFYNNPSEVKLIRNNTQLLFSCSGGACGIIDIASGELLYHVYPKGNPHSAELLPDGNIVTASSTGAFLMLFDLQRDPEGNIAKQYDCPSAHGVVYDEKTQRLYSCGREGITEWRYDSRKVELIKIADYPFPVVINVFGGHDLYRDLQDGLLTVSGRHAVYKFNCQTKEQTFFLNAAHVKSVSVHPKAPTLLLIPNEKWWNDELQIADKSGRVRKLIRYPHFRFYKVRWVERSISKLFEVDDKENKK